MKATLQKNVAMTTNFKRKVDKEMGRNSTVMKKWVQDNSKMRTHV